MEVREGRKKEKERKKERLEGERGRLKGIIAEIHIGVVLKQLNYPISMLPF